MIDIENYVITEVKTALSSTYPEASVYGVYVEAPSAFPCVCIVEDDNYTYTQSQDNDLVEHQANVMYSVNVYSNKKTGAKEEAKGIFDVVDLTLQNMKFTRKVRTQVPNVDRTIYRVTGRYYAVVQEPQTEGGKTVYQIYRK